MSQAAMQVSQLHAGVCGRPLPIRARPQVAVSRRPFCVEARKQLTVKESRIGKAPITVPAGVTFDVEGQTVTVKVGGVLQAKRWVGRNVIGRDA